MKFLFTYRFNLADFCFLSFAAIQFSGHNYITALAISIIGGLISVIGQIAVNR